MGKDNKENKKALKKESKKNEKALKKSNANKEKLGSKFIKVIKQRWLIKGTTTLLLIGILIAAFILINIGVKKLNLTAIDFTANKNYSLTDESKNRVKDIDKDVNIYFVGHTELDPQYVLAREYNNVNKRINVEIIDATENIEFAEKYKVTNESYAIVVECGEVSKVLYSSELYTYDSNYNEIDMTEQKITSAIVNVISDDIPKVYFLSGYTSVTMDYDTNTYGNSLYYLTNQYMADAALEYDTLDLLATKEVPDDCDTLVILTPEKDFDKAVADAIIKYIEKGGNILWLNGVYVEETKLTNVNRVLKQFGINPFEIGYVYETNTQNIMGYATCFKPNILDTDITTDIANKYGALLLNSTKINVNADKLEDLNVVETDLILSPDTSYFTKDFSGNDSTSNDTNGEFKLGVMMEKTISSKDEKAKESDGTDEDSDENAVKSTLILYANEKFITDIQLSSDTYPMIYQYNNADLFLNSIAYLTDNDEDITLRKSYLDKSTTFTPTDGEISVIVKIIFVVPVAIIALGIIVWIIRKNKK